jgi:hypothetical protein
LGLTVVKEWESAGGNPWRQKTLLPIMSRERPGKSVGVRR